MTGWAGRNSHFSKIRTTILKGKGGNPKEIMKDQNYVRKIQGNKKLLHDSFCVMVFSPPWGEYKAIEQFQLLALFAIKIEFASEAENPELHNFFSTLYT